jgi:N-acetylmuramic acid 6-phosphate etherase
MSDEPLAATEAANARTRDLDLLSSAELVPLLMREQRIALDAAADASAAIAGAVDLIAERLRAGGSLHYVGAGTSGRLGVLDAAEIPPTFGALPTLVRAHIAGGPEALFRAVEGAEDDAAAGEREARAALDAPDVLVAVSASGGAAYVIAWLRVARALGAATVAITSDAASPLVAVADHAIVLATGAEPIAGSTRMIAGTAQKLALNALSTAVMVRLGKVYDNLMVDVVATNAKLRARALRLVGLLAPADEAQASRLLADAGGSVKVAIVMARRQVDAAAARALLESEEGLLRPFMP